MSTNIDGKVVVLTGGSAGHRRGCSPSSFRLAEASTMPAIIVSRNSPGGPSYGAAAPVSKGATRPSILSTGTFSKA